MRGEPPHPAHDPAGEAAPLSGSLLAWYAAGTVPHGLALMAGTYLVFYYNQVLGVPGSQIGLAMLVASIFDGVTDPIAGAISDRTRGALGRRHPYLLACSLPLGGLFYLLWDPPAGLETAGLLVWLVALLLLQRLLGTFYSVPYMALGAELTRDYQERTRVTTARSYALNLGRAAGGAALLLYFLAPTEEYPNGQLDPANYPPFAFTFGILTAVFLAASAWQTRSEIPRLSKATGHQSWRQAFGAPFRDIREALRYPSFRSVTGTVVLQYTAFGVGDALGIFMATFFWGVGTDVLFLWGVAMFGGMFSGIEFWRRRSATMEKRTIYVIGSIGYLVAFISPYILKVFGIWPARESALYLPLYMGMTGFAAHFFAGGPTIMTGSMLGDVTDLDELEVGRRREGVIFGAESLAQKLFTGFGPVLAGLVVDLAGITAATPPDQVSPRAIAYLGLGQGGASLVLFLLSFLFLRRYDLTRQRHTEILDALSSRSDPGASSRP